MEKLSVTISLDAIEEDHIWTNKKGERCITCDLVNKPTTWPDGNESWGFISQWWKDETLPPGQYAKGKILGNVKVIGFKKQPAASKEDDHSNSSPF